MTDLDKYVDVDQAAEILGTTRMAVYKLLERRRLPATLFAGRYIFSRDDVMLYAAARRVTQGKGSDQDAELVMAHRNA